MKDVLRWIGVPFRGIWALISFWPDLFWLIVMAIFTAKIDPYFRDGFLWKWCWVWNPTKYGPQLTKLRYYDD